MTQVRFHSLDAFRFIAFLKVFLLHLPVAAGVFPLFDKLKAGGEVGVLFFFVLSGFLITHLLLLEKSETGCIRFSKFFLKRILRIWPVFFLTVGLVYSIPDVWLAKAGFFTVRGYKPEWIYSFTFLENYKMTLERMPPAIETLWVNWSICVEQHFYIVWPFVIWLTPVRRLPTVMILLILFANLNRCLSVIYWPDLPGNLNRFNDLLTNMDFLAFGGLAAWLVAYQGKDLSLAISRISQSIKWAFILVIAGSFSFSGLLLDSDNARLLAYPMYGVLFTVLLLLFSLGDSTLRISDTSWISFLGRISYGLYMYHLFVILIVAKILESKAQSIDTSLELATYILCTLALCIAISSASWKWLETPILQVKRKLVS